MKIEEAIKILHPDTTSEAIMKIEYYGGFRGKEKAIEYVNEASIVACEALEKQISKKPKEIRYFRAYNSYAGLCPVCNGGANSEFQYCGDCGQKLDWSVEE